MAQHNSGKYIATVFSGRGSPSTDTYNMGGEYRFVRYSPPPQSKERGGEGQLLAQESKNS